VFCLQETHLNEERLDMCSLQETYLNEERLNVCCLQETHLNEEQVFKIREYQCRREYQRPKFHEKRQNIDTN
jgi:exonuclease III